MEKPVQIGDGYLHHFKEAKGLIVAVFVRTENRENASEIFFHLQSKFVTAKQIKKHPIELFSQALMGRAYATDSVPCDPKLKETPNNLNTLITTGDSLTAQATPIQHVTACTMSSLKGVWNGSGGVVVGAAKGIGEFLMSPVESGKKYWQATSKLWDVTKQFFSDFEKEAQKLYSSFDPLDPLVKTKLACEVIGTIGGGALLTFLTTGALASSTTQTLLLKIRTAISTAINSAKFSGVRKTLAIRTATIEKVEINLNRNLFSINRGTAATSVLDNGHVLEGLKALPMKVNSSTRKIGASNDEIQQLFRQVSDHPVASLSKVSNYEKYTPGIGYCFGRATTAHLKALTNGMDKSSVRKVWALGHLKNGSTNWRYHVTTIVRDSKGEWQAIDPIMGRPMPIERWYREMKKYDSVGDMRIFETEAKRFGPESPNQYSRRQFKQGVYEDYFTDLMRVFQKETKELMSARKTAQ